MTYYYIQGNPDPLGEIPKIPNNTITHAMIIKQSRASARFRSLRTDLSQSFCLLTLLYFMMGAL